MPNTERRKASRFPLEIAARMEGEGKDGSTVQVAGSTRDVSSAGVFVLANNNLEAHVKVRVHLYLAGGRFRKIAKAPSVQVEVAGEVVRSEPDGMAVRFGPKYDIRPAGPAAVPGGEAGQGKQPREEDKIVLLQVSGHGPQDSARRRKEKRS